MEMVTCKVISLSACEMLESLKSAAAIYLVFLCCQPLFFPPENILSVVYEPSLFLSQIPNAPVYVYPVFSFLLPPFFPPFLPTLLSLLCPTLQQVCSSIHFFTHVVWTLPFKLSSCHCILSFSPTVLYQPGKTPLHINQQSTFSTPPGQAAADCRRKPATQAGPCPSWPLSPTDLCSQLTVSPMRIRPCLRYSLCYSKPPIVSIQRSYINIY